MQHHNSTSSLQIFFTYMLPADTRIDHSQLALKPFPATIADFWPMLGPKRQQMIEGLPGWR
jgi:hypothetical protein